MFGSILFRSISKNVKYPLNLIDICSEVKCAMFEKKPLVALESAIITHGMPYPENLITASSVENIIRKEGAVPATIAIIDGKIKIGLNEQMFEKLANTGTPKIKTSRRDFYYVLANKLNGGTTVSGTLLAANLVGIKIFVTGGIGGVHRKGEVTFDVSADLTELGRTPIMVISSGIKSILDIGKTLEYLETQGVCVAAFGSEYFPAFYSHKSNFKAPYMISSTQEAARLVEVMDEIKLESGILLAVPIPEKFSIDYEEMGKIIEKALLEAEEEGIMGKEITPFILKRLGRHTIGKSLESNISLIKNNAKIGAKIAVEHQNLIKERNEPSASFQGYIQEEKKPVMS